MSKNNKKQNTGNEKDSTGIIYLGDQPFEVTPEKRSNWEFHDNEMKMGWLYFSLHLAIILDQKLYQVAGYKTQEEYAKYHLGESLSGMKKKAISGRRILAAFPNGEIFHQNNKDQLEKIAEIGPSRFYELSKLDNEDFDLKQFAEDGKGELPSGKEITLEEMKKQTFLEFREELQQERQAQNKTITELKKLNKDQEEEINKQALENERIKKDSAQGMAYAAKYDRKDRTFRMWQQILENLEHLMSQVNSQINVMHQKRGENGEKGEGLPVEPAYEELCHKLHGIMGDLERARQNLGSENHRAMQSYLEGGQPVQYHKSLDISPEKKKILDEMMDEIENGELDDVEEL